MEADRRPASQSVSQRFWRLAINRKGTRVTGTKCHRMGHDVTANGIIIFDGSFVGHFPCGFTYPDFYLAHRVNKYFLINASVVKTFL